MFTSARERRLWISMLAVVAAIGTTLAFGSQVARLVVRDDIAAVVFVLAMAITVIAVVGAKSRLWQMAGLGAVYLMAFFRVGSLAERTHLFEYTLVAALIHEALVERGANDRPVRYPAAISFLAASVIGLVDEAVQALIPSRVFDPVDIVFNTAAAALAVTARLVTARPRRS